MSWGVVDAARWYRSMGWNPLPSSRATRHPVAAYSNLWDTPIEREVLDRWPIDLAGNVQLMTGSAWSLAVVDLDGPDALDAWSDLTRYRRVPHTWTVRTGSGGYHLYFALPESHGEIPRCVLWEGVGSHSRIDLLAERSLVIAPPSIHHRTGLPYRWVVGPSLETPGLAPLPRWIAEHAAGTIDRLPVAHDRSCERVPSSPPWMGASYSRGAVLEAIRDKLSLVRSWGLRIAGWRVSRNGWLPCRSLYREDRHPSAGFNRDTGYYSEPAERLRMSLFDIAVALGVYPSWVEACNDLGHRYI